MSEVEPTRILAAIEAHDRAARRAFELGGEVAFTLRCGVDSCRRPLAQVLRTSTGPLFVAWEAERDFKYGAAEDHYLTFTRYTRAAEFGGGTLVLHLLSSKLAPARHIFVGCPRHVERLTVSREALLAHLRAGTRGGKRDLVIHPAPHGAR